MSTKQRSRISSCVSSCRASGWKFLASPPEASWAITPPLLGKQSDNLLEAPFLPLPPHADLEQSVRLFFVKYEQYREQRVCLQFSFYLCITYRNPHSIEPLHGLVSAVAAHFVWPPSPQAVCFQENLKIKQHLENCKK